jgi:hypothetical protein
MAPDMINLCPSSIWEGRSSESKEKRIEQIETSLLLGHSLNLRETKKDENLFTPWAIQIARKKLLAQLDRRARDTKDKQTRKGLKKEKIETVQYLFFFQILTPESIHDMSIIVVLSGKQNNIILL